jgi:hypothetical protein
MSGDSATRSRIGNDLNLSKTSDFFWQNWIKRARASYHLDGKASVSAQIS